MNEITVRVEAIDDFFTGALAAARRIDAGDRAQSPATLSFETMELLLKALTPNRWTLLRTLRAKGHSSIRSLSQELHRDYRGVHGDVMALLECGLIERTDDGKVAVPWSRITAEIAIDAAA
jgi:predicted transcriptional regulator